MFKTGIHAAWRLATAVIALMFIPRQPAAQPDSNYVLTFSFNDHRFKEDNDKIKIRPVGVSLTDDRFGNKESALYLHGHEASYLSLGTSPLLKPKSGTISLWVNLDRRVYTGKGYQSNPIIITKNGPGDDFYVAYEIFYDCYAGRFAGGSTKDSTKESMIKSVKEPAFNKWYHLVITYDDDYFSFYVNGELQQKTAKNFETRFLKTDSVVIGNTANKKNNRWSEGSFDDIQIYNRVLNDKEVKNLYEAPDPNTTRNLLKYIAISIAFVLLIALAAYMLVSNNRHRLRKEEENYRLKSKLNELETKVLKAQMNPHFMFNALNTIQQFIIFNDNEKAQFYLSKFSRLVRKMLENTTKENISLAEEIEILVNYLELESPRFNNVFTYKIEIGKEIAPETVSIPHFLVQPFVENAIWHGLLKKEGAKNLLISFEFAGAGRLRCVIDDNGVGRKEGEPNKEKKSLAINIIRQRLDLINKVTGSDFNLCIIDKKNNAMKSEGTRVIITLPVNKNN